jgi:Uma2 family endonuclease
MKNSKICDLEKLYSLEKYSGKRLEYIHPHLIIEEMATPITCSFEQVELIGQIGEWRHAHWNDRGAIGNYKCGYAFGGSSHRNYQLMPDASYIDQKTRDKISLADRTRAFLPCVPTVVIELASETDDIGKLKDKVSLFMQHGTREGLIIDTRRQNMWIFNDKKRPVCYPLGTVFFDYWPGLKVDCVLVRKARTSTHWDTK